MNQLAASENRQLAGQPTPRSPDYAGLFRLCRDAGRKGLQQLFLAVNKRVGVVGGDFKTVAVGDGVTRASFHAIAAEDAPVVIDIIDLGIALRGADTVVAGILRGLNVNAIGRASRRAEEAGDALFQSAFVAAQNMD